MTDPSIPGPSPHPRSYCIVPSQRIFFNVTCRNVDGSLQECINSLLKQRNKNWICYVTDDASSDATAKILKILAKEHPERIRPVFNQTRKWKMYNFAVAIKHAAISDIIVELDGDDALLHDTFVDEIQCLHQKYDVVWTQHNIDASKYPDWHRWYSTDLPDGWSRIEPPRTGIWTKNYHPGHIRTFKRAYFDHIDQDHLKFRGEWLKTTADAAYYTPIIEMVPRHLRYFYDRPSSVYTITDSNDTLHENNLHQRGGQRPDSAELQSHMGRYIRSLSPYTQLPSGLCIGFLQSDDVVWYAELMARWRHTDPCIRFHLFFFDSFSRDKAAETLGGYGIFLYDLDRLVNNTLSPVRQKYGVIPVGVSYASYLYPWVLKYVTDNHLCEYTWFVAVQTNMRLSLALHQIRASRDSSNTNKDVLFYKVRDANRQTLMKFHLRNMSRLRKGLPALDLSELNQGVG